MDVLRGGASDRDAGVELERSRGCVHARTVPDCRLRRRSDSLRRSSEGFLYEPAVTPAADVGSSGSRRRATSAMPTARKRLRAKLQRSRPDGLALPENRGAAALRGEPRRQDHHGEGPGRSGRSPQRGTGHGPSDKRCHRVIPRAPASELGGFVVGTLGRAALPLVRALPLDAAREKLAGGLGVQRSGEQEALTDVALLLAQERELAVILDPLGDGLDAQRLAEFDEGVDQARSLRVVGQAGDERAVDLQCIHGELAQVPERGVARAEVVDRDPHAEALDLTEPADRLLGVSHQRRLGDLECQVARIEAAGPKRLLYVLADLVTVELARGDVYGD